MRDAWKCLFIMAAVWPFTRGPVTQGRGHCFNLLSIQAKKAQGHIIHNNRSASTQTKYMLYILMCTHGYRHCTMLYTYTFIIHKRRVQTYTHING
ncbi:hypothetical protein GDO81_002581 [Engystomops pustulosus]|uniref:Secreted protein n=1 Tax=Engystomops pustulosus TaxID=76066 RepID=A0AAV7DLY0_ENGPU|nr:hypothetical protein GDO81_002581 [Engystomops pustulosus]